jgi:hypothetical protein
MVTVEMMNGVCVPLFCVCPCQCTCTYVCACVFVCVWSEGHMVTVEIINGESVCACVDVCVCACV